MFRYQLIPIAIVALPFLFGNDMDKYVYNYDEWLSGHTKRKTMMEKLERSLVPFEIFEAIGLVNDKLPRSGEVVVGSCCRCQKK